MKEIFFDEAGNTGPDLLNKDQSVYVLCSTNFSNTESKLLLEKYFNIDNEIHFKKKRKTENGKKQIVNFIKNNKVLLQEHCKIELYHKEFLANCYFIDYFIEPFYYEHGIDFYDYGNNIAFSNMLYICLQSFCGKKEANILYQSFIDYVRNQTVENRSKIKNSIVNVKEKCKYSEFRDNTISLIEECYSYIDENLSHLNGSFIDPTLPAFIHSIQLWMEQYKEGIIVKHDESNTLLSQINTIDFLKELDGKKCKIGYGAFKAGYPLNIKDLGFVKSPNSTSIQICDLLASSFAFIHNKIPDKDIEFGNELKNILLTDYQITNCIWPDTNVLPQPNRKKNEGDINPVDYLTYQYFIKNNN